LQRIVFAAVILFQRYDLQGKKSKSSILGRSVDPSSPHPK